ncbi:MAG: dihydroorotate dehydrogenase [Clostridiales bacterium]|jgi:dihydroorotate dehydrogenase (NAD+) catalytic subunit|nr:dihydroorotate dehydrogenase [Clostridiales bacterium]
MKYYENPLSLNLCGIDLKNPVIAASGTFAFGFEFSKLYEIEKLGGISVKGLTREPREGNPSPRIAETYGGVLNSVGLQNPGVETFAKNLLPFLAPKDIAVIANIAGSTEEDYCYMAERLSSEAAVSFIELNISCPNVKAGGMAFGIEPKSVQAITKLVKKYSKKPLIVKLSPNVADIALNAKAAENAGADAISLINTVQGMAVNAETRRPILKNVFGGLSGPAIKPIALRMVWQVYNAVKIPIIGMGGIMNETDAIEFFLCGATAVQIGTANLIDPLASLKIVEGLRHFVERNKLKNLQDIRGKLIVE